MTGYPDNKSNNENILYKINLLIYQNTFICKCDIFMNIYIQLYVILVIFKITSVIVCLGNNLNVQSTNFRSN